MLDVNHNGKVARLTSQDAQIILQPRLAQSHYHLGQVFAKQEQWEKAIASYRQALQIEARSEVYLSLAAALVRNGKNVEAIECYHHAIEQQPNLGQAHHDLGDLLQKQGRLEEAISAYEKAIEFEPGFSWSYNNLGDTLRDLERWEEASTAYQNAIELNPNFAWSHYNLGDVLVNLKRWDEASSTYLTAISLQNDLPAINQKLSEALWWKFKSARQDIINVCDRAIKEDPDNLKSYYKALSIDPQNENLYLALGDRLVQQNKVSGAIAIYQAALQYHPVNASLYSKIAEILVEQRHYNDAILNCQQAIAIKPNASTFYLLGFSLEKNKEFDSAITAYHQAIQLDINNLKAHLHLGLVLLIKKQWNESTIALKRALKLNPDESDLPEIYAELGRAFLEKGNLNEAIQYCEKSLALEPDRWQVFRYLGDALRKQGKQEKAIKNYQTAIKLKPDFPWIHNSLADTFREIDCWDKAECYYYSFLEMVPDHYWANHHLAQVLIKQEKWDEATISYRKLLQIDPENSDVNKKLEKLL